jgi:Zn-dependent peptidase ImmA (M78 family)
MSFRDAILNGAKAAGALHEECGTREPIEAHRRSNIDIFGSILSRKVTLLFRPLEGLLGAFINGRGVIITTNRPLAVQRFTGAHELGHVAMRHEFSLDGEEILTGKMPNRINKEELEADSFASEFLLPRWLLGYHATRQGWNAESMRNPTLVYQLSLRVGASYEATARALERYKIVDQQCRDELLQIAPKSIKQQLLPGYSPENWYRDVWLITRKDEGGFLEGQPHDLFLFRLNESAGAGYLWDFDTVVQQGFVIASDQRIEDPGDVKIGADVTRLLTAHSPKQPKGQFDLKLRRPWLTATVPLEQVRIGYDLLGKEIGLPRMKRLEFAAAA